MAEKLFCERGPLAYKLSVKKETLKRSLRDRFSNEPIARTKSEMPLPCLLTSHSSVIVRRLAGVDLRMQENKRTNLRLACEKLNGLVIRPGETFSFWLTIGKPSKKNGYLEGLYIEHGKVGSGIGGGLCQMGNLIHYMVLHSALEVTELHHHSDALFPDERRRVPFGTGTSVSYNYIDYRFKNTGDHDVQLLVWTDDEELHGELRSAAEDPHSYELVEEDHHFSREGDAYFRNSKVYRLIRDKATGEVLKKELLLENHSRVMYDPALIPPEQIR
ncbi:MAG: VanW family protein [Clostridia bacterium]|nr:VanW family protein [Clostridia bacterium]